MSKQYFGTPQFNKVGKLFQDLPIEALDKALTGMNKAYSENLAGLTATQAMMAQKKVSKADEHIKQREMDALQKEIDDFAQNEGLEKADMFTSMMASKFLANKALNHATAQHTKQEQDDEIRRQLIASGNSVIDARAINNRLTDGQEFQSVGVDEQGNEVYNDYQSGFVKKLDTAPAMDRVWNDMKAVTTTGYGDTDQYGIRDKYTSTGFSKKRITGNLDNAFTQYKGTNEYKNQLLELQTQNVTGTDADALIKQQLLAVGMEREGVSTTSAQSIDHRAQARAKAAADNAPLLGKSMVSNEPGAIITSDPDGVFGGKDVAKTLFNKRSYQGVRNDGKKHNYNWDNAYVLSKKDSDSTPWTDVFAFRDSGDDGKMKQSVSVEGVTQDFHIQGYVLPDGGILQVGKGADTELGRSFDADPEIRSLGGNAYEVQDKKGNWHKTNLKSFSQFHDKNNTYLVPQDRFEEQINFPGMGTTAFIPVGKMTGETSEGISGNTYHIEPGYNDGGNAELALEIANPYKTPESTRGAIVQDMYGDLQMELAKRDPENTSAYQEAQADVFNVLNSMLNNGKSTGDVIKAFQSILNTDKVGTTYIKNEEGKSVRVFTETGKVLGALLNKGFDYYKTSTRQIQSAKDEYTGQQFYTPGYGGETEE